ncbi:hypothetical protein GCM10027044_17630 [Hymenobacter ruber]
MVLVALLSTSAAWAQSTANYAFTTSSTGSLVDMSSGTTDALATGTYRDDVASAVFPIGFNFVFMGTSYTQFSVNSNGQLRLGATAISGGAASPTSGAAILAAFGGDNAIQIAGKVHYKVVAGTNRTLVVEWNSLRIPYSSTVATGSVVQAILEENTGKVEYRYGAVYNNSTAVSRPIFISAGTNAGQIGVVKTFNTTPTYDATVTSATTTTLVDNAAVAVLNSTADGARTTFAFTPTLAGTPATPGLASGAVGQTTVSLTITDNSTNESFFAVSSSTDNVNFTVVGAAQSNSITGTGSTVTFTQTGLALNTTYYFRVTANNEAGGTSTTSPTVTVTTLAAVPLCGTKSIGPGAGADYPTLTAAFSALALNGICGPLALELQASYVSTAETFPLAYTFTGSTATNTVTIRPAAGANGLSISSSASQTLNINGGRYLILDGRPGGSGSTVSGAVNTANDLVIANTSTSGQTIQFTNDASFNTVQHCQVKGVGTSTFSYPNINFSSTTTTNGNSDNVIRFNNIGDGATLPYGLMYSGSSLNARNTITDNNLFNYYGASASTAAALYLSSAGNNWVLTNNSIYQTTARTPTAATHYGLYVAAGNGHTITGNFIGGTAPLAGGTPSTVTGTAAAYRFVGIYLSTSGTATSVQGNTIANISWLSSSGAATSNGVFSGIYVSTGDANIGTVTGNTVGIAAGPIAVSISTAAGYSFGISTASSGTVAIAKNVISNITTSGSTATIASNVAGINLGGGTLNTVNQNKIYALIAASGGASLSNGILITAGTTNNVNNNLIGGITAPTSTSLAAVSGIQLSGGTTNNLAFNTIRLDGTSSGATFGTQGIYLNSTTAGLNLYDNIVVNLSTPVGTGGAAAAIRRISGTAGTVPANLFGNNNLYYAGTPSATNLIYTEGTTTQTNAKQTLADYKAFLLNRETNSVTETSTPFASTTGTDATFLHLTAGATTQAESAGQPFGGVTTDFDGDVRNANTPDIGADEGSFQLLDQTGPIISINSFTGTVGNTTSRALTVTITDISGVATGTGAPRLYFRKNNTGAYVLATGPTVAGSAYTFTFDYSLIGGVVTGDIISYYIAAQDALGNLSTNPTGGTGTTPPGTTAPGVTYTYTIGATLNGTYYVSATAATSPVPARTYATLTAAVNAYNTADLTGPVTFLLLDPTYSTAETFPIAILNNGQASATNTLTIKPSNATGTTSFAITGSNATAILQLLASDYVTIDGSLGNTISATDLRPSRDLAITNTNTSTTSIVVQQFAQFTNDGATYNTIKNLVAVGATTAATAATQYGIQLQAPSNALSANQYTNNTVQNCAVRGTQIGIGSIGASATLKNQNTIITQNDLNTVGTGALTRAGILSLFDNNIQVTQNAIDGIAFASTGDVVGISLGFGLSLSNSTFTGSEVTNATVSRNSIGSVRQTNTYSASGIAIASAASGTTVVANNMVSGVSSNGTSPDFGSGILIGGGTGSTTRVLYNSVSMTGTQTGGDQPSFALAIGSSSTLELRNNALLNTQSTGSNSAVLGFAYAGTAGAYAGLTSTNNAFVASTGSTFAVGQTGSLSTSGTLRTTLAALNTETGQDRPTTATNPVGTSFSLSASPFQSATNLHVSLATGAALNGAATPITGITTDFDGDTRSTTRPDIGADEFVTNLDVSVAALTAPVANSTCFGATEAVTASITNSSTAVLDFAATPVTVTVTITSTVAGSTPQVFTTVVNTGTLAAGASQTVTLPGTIDLTVLGTYTATVTTSLVGDDNTANNTLSPAVTITSGSRSAAFTYPTAAICAGATGTVAATLGTGATAGTFTSTTGLTINATTGAITPATSTAGTYTVTNTLPATATCPATVVTQSVTITPLPSAAFSYGGGTFCVSGTNPTATVTGTAGGTFTSTTGLTINATTGAITLSSTTPGTYTVTYSVTGACSNSSTQVVTITTAPSATFSYGTGTPSFCVSGATNPAPSFGTGASGGTFTSTTGLTINATTGAITLASSTPGTYTVTNTIAASGGCAAATATAQVTITAAPVATFSYGTTSTYCVSGTTAPAVVLGTGATAGTFSSTTGLSLNATTGAITLSSSTPGTYTVTNTIAAANGCSAATATAQVTITAAPVATFSYATTSYCVSGATNPAVALGTGATAGTFTSTTGLTLNATTGAITLSSSTPGTYTVTNTIAASGGCAAATATTTVTITAAPVATFSYGTTSTYCVSGTTAPAVVLGTGATAGTFSSTTGLSLNATTGAITLSSSTPGTYTVTNTVAAASGCAATTATTTVTITAAPTATFSYATTTGCAGSTTAVTPTLGTGASAGTYSSTTGLVINATTGAINLATSTAGTYTVTNTVAAAGGCAAATATATFTVNPRPATPTISVVYNGTTTTLTSSATTGNQWYLSGNIITGATGQTYVVNGLPAQFGSYTVVVTNANGCTSLPSTPLVITAARNSIAGASLQVYPNPTPMGQMTLELTGYRLATQLTVLDALGRVVISELLPANAGTATRTLDLKGVTTGVYLLRLRNADGVETRRLVRE